MILDIAGETVFATGLAAHEHPGAVSVRLIDALTALLTNDGPLVPEISDPRDCGGRLFGFFVRDRLKAAKDDAIRFGVEQNVKVDVPVGLWYHRPFATSYWCDPYEVIVGSDQRGDVDFASICDFYGVAVPAQDVFGQPAVQAELARNLAIKGQLFPMPA